MSGMINGTAPPEGGQPSDGSALSNPLLAQAETQLEAKLMPANKADYDKIVVAGLHIALQNGSGGFMAKLAASKDPIGDAARGAASLVLIMRKQAHGVMPMKSGVPAGMTLLFHALDFIDRAKIAKIAEPEIDKASTIYVNFLFAKLHITPAMLQQMTGKVQGLMSDPTSMAAISLKSGLTRHPMAATPTPLPGGPPGMINGGPQAGG
jgi:hypothetical protein